MTDLDSPEIDAAFRLEHLPKPVRDLIACFDAEIRKCEEGTAEIEQLRRERDHVMRADYILPE